MVYVTRGSALLDAEAVCQHLNVTAGMKIADLGCGGHGHFTLHLARLVGTSGVVYAVDILKSALTEVARKARLENAGNVKPVWSNLELAGATAIPAASLDAAVLVNVLFQTSDRAGVLREASRLLKRGGQVLVLDWKATSAPLGPPLTQRLTPKTVAAHAAAAGLTLKEAFHAGKYHYGMVFTKP